MREGYALYCLSFTQYSLINHVFRNLGNGKHCNTYYHYNNVHALITIITGDKTDNNDNEKPKGVSSECSVTLQTRNFCKKVVTVSNEPGRLEPRRYRFEIYTFNHSTTFYSS